MTSSDEYLDRAVRAFIVTFALAGISCAAFDSGALALATWSALASLFFATGLVVMCVAGYRAMREGR